MNYLHVLFCYPQMLDADILPSGVDDVIRSESHIHKRSSVGTARKRLSTFFIDYEAFRFDEPKFTTDGDRQLFYKLQENVNTVGAVSRDKLRGVVAYFAGGLVSFKFPCSWRTSLKKYSGRTWMRARHNVAYLCPLLVKDGAASNTSSSTCCPS